MSSDLTEAVVIADGGWHARYARVLLIQQFEDEAVVLVDGNGDGGEIEDERWYRDGGRWYPGPSGGMGPLELRPIWTWGEATGSGFVIGYDPESKGPVTVEWLGRRTTAAPDTIGLWIAVFPNFEPPSERSPDVPANGFRKWAPGEWEQLEAAHRRQRPKLVSA